MPRGGKSAVKNAAKLINNDQSLEQAFNELNKVAVNLKYDSDTRKIHNELKKMNEEMLVEFKLLNTIKTKVKSFMNKVLGFFTTFFSKLKKKSAVEIIDGLDFDLKFK